MKPAVVLLAFAIPFSVLAAPAPHPVSELIGTWEGTSTCTDRVLTPACKDEIAVYEFTAGAQPGTAHWVADKVVDGKRVTMGEMDMTYDPGDACWKSEFKSATAHVVWCLKVDGAKLTGSAWHLPGKQVVRKVDTHKK